MFVENNCMLDRKGVRQTKASNPCVATLPATKGTKGADNDAPRSVEWTGSAILDVPDKITGEPVPLTLLKDYLVRFRVVSPAKVFNLHFQNTNSGAGSIPLLDLFDATTHEVELVDLDGAPV